MNYSNILRNNKSISKLITLSKQFAFKLFTDDKRTYKLIPLWNPIKCPTKELCKNRNICIEYTILGQCGLEYNFVPIPDDELLIELLSKTHDFIYVDITDKLIYKKCSELCIDYHTNKCPGYLILENNTEYSLVHCALYSRFYLKHSVKTNNNLYFELNEDVFRLE